MDKAVEVDGGQAMTANRTCAAAEKIRDGRHLFQ